MLDAPVLPTPIVAVEGRQADVADGAAFGRQLVTVPALLPMAGTLRRAVDSFLTGHPRRVDARQVVDEFATTALIELRCTCCPHGQVTLAVDWDERRIRLEVSYFMTLSHAPMWRMDWCEDPVDTYGRGLALVNAFCDRWGHMARQVGEPYYADKHQTWYAELDHIPPQLSASGE